MRRGLLAAECIRSRLPSMPWAWAAGSRWARGGRVTVLRPSQGRCAPDWCAQAQTRLILVREAFQKACCAKANLLFGQANFSGTEAAKILGAEICFVSTNQRKGFQNEQETSRRCCHGRGTGD